MDGCRSRCFVFSFARSSKLAVSAIFSISVIFHKSTVDLKSPSTFHCPGTKLNFVSFLFERLAISERRYNADENGTASKTQHTSHQTENFEKILNILRRMKKQTFIHPCLYVCNFPSSPLACFCCCISTTYTADPRHGGVLLFFGRRAGGMSGYGRRKSSSSSTRREQKFLRLSRGGGRASCDARVIRT